MGDFSKYIGNGSSRETSAEVLERRGSRIAHNEQYAKVVKEGSAAPVVAEATEALAAALAAGATPKRVREALYSAADAAGYFSADERALSACRAALWASWHEFASDADVAASLPDRLRDAVAALTQDAVAATGLRAVVATLAALAPSAPTLVNLTPHTVAVHPLNGGAAIVVAPSGTVARVTTESVPLSALLSTVRYGVVEGVPEQIPGTLYIVSGLVRAACQGRTDVASPGELIRDAAGQPTGCRGLVVNEATS